MKIEVMCWHKVITTEVITDGFLTDCEVTEEQFKRIEDSFRTGNYQYMTDDESLKDITEALVEEGRQDAETSYGEMGKRLTSVIDYPETLVQDCGGIEQIDLIKNGGEGK